TDNPYKVTVTEGVLTKVSFGVKLPEPINEETNKPTNDVLLKVSISQDPVLLKQRLSVTAEKDKDNIIFTINCNYFLFIEKASLTLYGEDYKTIKTIPLPKPLPSRYSLPASELETEQTVYYQLSVYDKTGKEDRTGVGSFKIE
ncbi:MAG: hypothetical protein V1927_02740, partial [Candidatus Omnitrophota bacterium]